MLDEEGRDWRKRAIWAEAAIAAIRDWAGGGMTDATTAESRLEMVIEALDHYDRGDRA